MVLLVHGSRLEFLGGVVLDVAMCVIVGLFVLGFSHLSVVGLNKAGGEPTCVAMVNRGGDVATNIFCTNGIASSSLRMPLLKLAVVVEQLMMPETTTPRAESTGVNVGIELRRLNISLRRSGALLVSGSTAWPPDLGPLRQHLPPGVLKAVAFTEADNRLVDLAWNLPLSLLSGFFVDDVVVLVDEDADDDGGRATPCRHAQLAGLATVAASSRGGGGGRGGPCSAFSVDSQEASAACRPAPPRGQADAAESGQSGRRPLRGVGQATGGGWVSSSTQQRRASSDACVSCRTFSQRWGPSVKKWGLAHVLCLLDARHGVSSDGQSSSTSLLVRFLRLRNHHRDVLAMPKLPSCGRKSNVAPRPVRSSLSCVFWGPRVLHALHTLQLGVLMHRTTTRQLLLWYGIDDSDSPWVLDWSYIYLNINNIFRLSA